MTTNDTILEINNISVCFDGFYALTDVRTKVKRNTIHFFIGPNGAGKTTLLDIICAKTKPTAGTVIYYPKGKDPVRLTGMKEYKIVNEGVGRKFQVPSVFVNLSVEENMILALKDHKGILDSIFRKPSKEEMQDIHNTLKRVSLEEKAGERAGSLAHGEKQWLESTEEEAQHMKKLIDQMLFLAKSDAETAQVELSDVDFSSIVEGTSLNFEPIAFEKEVFLDLEIESGIVLHGNSMQLNQLAHILIDNAVKYSEKQGVVKICLSNKGDKIEFSVNNKGNVISPEDLEHIFDRFYRAEKSRSTKGYGLGLAIAQSIVQSMNGKLTAESDAENGTTFTAEFKTGK